MSLLQFNTSSWKMFSSTILQSVLLVAILFVASTSPATVPGTTKAGKPVDRTGKQYNRYYLHQCHKDDPQVNECLIESANTLLKNFQRGIPELGVTNVEPIVIDEIHLALGSGPNGYRATFKEVTAYGVSNMTVIGARSDLSSNQFQFTFHVPKISIRAHYRSSGVLIMVPATGGGEYWGEYDDCKAKVYLKASEYSRSDGRRYLRTEDLKMDFTVKNLKMGIEKVHNGNQILEAALNLFINSNSQELLKEMKPDIKKKLLVQMKTFLDDHLFAQIPYDEWVV
uniref:Circadian clock-controlled protein n=1 Tax=Cacopsylla melanoneura TaxID=428564 RepID=A0A8D8LL64_9HEMI